MHVKTNYALHILKIRSIAINSCETFNWHDISSGNRYVILMPNKDNISTVPHEKLSFIYKINQLQISSYIKS